MPRYTGLKCDVALSGAVTVSIISIDNALTGSTSKAKDDCDVCERVAGLERRLSQ